MVDFMVIALPRSGTTWAANWLTEGEVSCRHDPLYTSHYNDWRGRAAVSGVACTGIWRWAEWVNRQHCRKVILHRPLDEITRSLHRIGFDQMAIQTLDTTALGAINGIHVPWTDLFDPGQAPGLWSYLTGGRKMDLARHEQLVQMKIEPHWPAIKVDRGLQALLAAELSLRS